tara:strand:- start:1083 stop:1325 length:243 start_codon:yes stop_codon:yes gene_type:complete
MRNPPTIELKFHDEEVEFGEYYEESNTVRIFLHRHESVCQIFDTIEHEILHKCIGDTDESIDIYQEHRLIFNALWFKEMA